MKIYLRYAYVEIIQISYYSDRTILSYKESAWFTGTTLVHFFLTKEIQICLESANDNNMA